MPRSFLTIIQESGLYYSATLATLHRYVQQNFSFAQRSDEFKKLNTELIGLSVDSKISHMEWINWIHDNLKIDIKFPIIADPMGNVARNLGMIHAESATSTVRAVFIVDNKSTVRAILYYPLEIGRNISEILRMIKALQMVDKFKIATPANWPNNELIKSAFINPPPATMNDIPERMKNTAAMHGGSHTRMLPRRK